MADGMEVNLIGWHEMGEAEYHSDPCPVPSLSASIAKTLITSSPLHAWLKHPKNPESEPFEPSSVMNIGKAVHAAVFGGADIDWIDADSFRTKASKEQRDEALQAGLIPILAKDREVIEAMAHVCRDRFEKLYGGPEFHAERVAIWRCPRTGGWRRAMLDTSALEAPIIVDLKTTKSAIDDESAIKRIFADGHHIQAAAYEEAMEVLNPEWEGRVKFYFQYQEQNAPFALSRPIEMGESAMTIGREQWRAAGAIWDACVSKMQFPAYSIQPTEASPPLWFMSQWEIQKGMNPLYEGVV
ncbi:MAG: PD-(D/E)XK nuclease-like domain-containing protein [Pseudomonadota bacterium]